MGLKVIKRDGRAVEYNNEKIKIAIEKANKEVNEDKKATQEEINQIIDYIESLDKKRILVEDIQDIIEEKLMELGKYDLAKKYIVYRYTRTLVRKQNTTDGSILRLIKDVNNVSENDSKTSLSVSTQRNLIACEVSMDLTKRILLPEKIIKAHNEGVLYFHATEYFLQPIINSCVVNIEDMLDNGIVINNMEIKQPNTFVDACNVLNQIIACIESSQYGEQCINLKYLGKFLKQSCEKIRSELQEISDVKLIEKITYKILEDELCESIKSVEYELNTLITTSGKNLDITFILELDSKDEYYKENLMIVNEILKQRVENFEKSNKNSKNFPNLICIFRNLDDNVLQNLSALVYQCDGIINPKDIEKYQYEGRFNQGIVSINLPQIALSIAEDENEFWNLLNERLEICYEALMCRHYALLGTISNVSPIHWQNGAIARLQPGEKIDKLLKDGYSDITLGYVGFNQTVEILGLAFNWNEENKEKFESKLFKVLEDTVQKWKKMTGLGFTLEEIIGTDANYELYNIDKMKYEKFLSCLDKDFY